MIKTATALREVGGGVLLRCWKEAKLRTGFFGSVAGDRLVVGTTTKLGHRCLDDENIDVFPPHRTESYSIKSRIPYYTVLSFVPTI